MSENLENLLATLAAEASVVTPAPHPYRLALAWFGAGMAYLVAVLALSGVRVDWPQAFIQPLFLAEILALFGILLSTAVSSALLAYPDLYQQRRLCWAPLWAFAALLSVLALAGFGGGPALPLPVHSFECTLSIAGVAVPPALWTFFSLRRFASTHVHAAGAIAVLSAFGIGALWLRLHEANDAIVHVALWHYLPMLAAGIVGMQLGRRLLRW